jgi:hypothetical protein
MGQPLPARSLHGAAALLCASVLADSAVEHYRGAFRNPAMFGSLGSSSLGLLTGLSGAMGWRGGRRSLYLVTIAAGLAGTGFHLYNLAKRRPKAGWNELFYDAPLGAPSALTLAGVIGLAADRLDHAPEEGSRVGRFLAGLISLGLAGTVGEAGLLHFRGAFQNPAMYLPVTVPPVAAALVASAAAGAPRDRWFTRLWLIATAGLGFAGPGLHAYGVSRAMGGWRNWRQNMVDGPPIPAPPAFTALALAGLAALRLIRRSA